MPVSMVFQEANPGGITFEGTMEIVRTRRFWVLPLHIGLSAEEEAGNHWALAIMDLSSAQLFWFDSAKYRLRNVKRSTGRTAAQHRSWEQHLIKQFIWGTYGAVFEITVREVDCPQQIGDWECGMWVLEGARWFFQNVDLAPNGWPKQPKKWEASSPWDKLAKPGTNIKERFADQWLKLIRAEFGREAVNGIREPRYYSNSPQITGRVRREPTSPTNPAEPTVWPSPETHRAAYVIVLPVYDHSKEGGCHCEPDHELEYVGWREYELMYNARKSTAERTKASEGRGDRGSRAAAREAERTKTEAQKKKDASLRRKAMRKNKARIKARRERIAFDEEGWIDENETDDSSEED
ncbi:hypothetical protein QBC43DRAFT_363132 [Cladorrhinum sp. PSN259]|nr:hypothetical protein QBC43DRAFT_363132 [Cladorrhinum sp. PSN259]